jgi:hypothetical protein
MENTNQNPFQPDLPEFFLARGETPIGPYRPSEIHQLLLAKDLSWVDYCYREKEDQWIRICDHPVFQGLQAAPPPKPVIKKVTPPPSPLHRLPPEPKWFLHRGGVQSGPYSESEIKRWIQIGQVGADAHVWNDSLPDWQSIADQPAFRGLLPAGALPAERVSTEKRTHPRKPLAARIYMTNQREVASGLCRDVSVGGMQVLTDELPGQAGDTLHLNVLPPADSGLHSFAARGIIVRILEDQRGFSFRFTDISPEAVQSIEKYIEKSAENPSEKQIGK